MQGFFAYIRLAKGAGGFPACPEKRGWLAPDAVTGQMEKAGANWAELVRDKISVLGLDRAAAEAEVVADAAEFMLENGFVDMIVERKQMRSTLSRLLKMHNYKKTETLPGKDS